MSLDLPMDQSLFDNQDFLELFPDVSHSEYTVVPSQVFTPPTPQHDWAMSFEAYDTCAGLSSILDEIARPSALDRPQDDKKGPKHGVGFELSRETKDAKQKAPMGPRVVPRNAFPCRHESCIGKDRKPKYFQRKYHRDRHERTVHQNSMHRCWVRGCQSAPFTRVDNLKGHLKNTHGRKAWSGKYQYVATQDESSIHYDPEWTGEIGEDGLPRGT